MNPKDILKLRQRLARVTAVALAMAIAPQPNAVVSYAGTPENSIDALAYATDATSIVVSYHQEIGEIRDADRGPSLTAFGDGRVLVHFPHYMKRAGDYSLRLSRGELDALIASLAESGVADFDVAAVERARGEQIATRRQAAATGTGFGVNLGSDEATSVIELRLDNLSGSFAGRRRSGPVVRRIAWTGLRLEAKHLPEIPELGKLATAEATLQGLMQDRRLERGN